MDQLISLMQKSESELNEIVDTGMFNEVIKGYLVLALQETTKTYEEIMGALIALDHVFDDVDAAQARKAYRELRPEL